MPPLLHLNDEERNLLHGLAQPIAWGKRDEFLRAVASALADRSAIGPGEIYRTARAIQKNFTLESQREAEIGGTSRYSRAAR